VDTRAEFATPKLKTLLIAFAHGCECTNKEAGLLRSAGGKLRSLLQKSFVPCFKEELVKRLRSKMPGDDAIEETRILFATLADRARLKILRAFGDGEELCVCDVANVLGTSISTASHHLRKLRDLRLLKYRNDGKMSYYSLRDKYAAKLAVEVVGKVRVD
jgi:ArsR family transcriptional regulator, lead/cadmium/zinc/bismuth-responsive transcriptional repressor